VPLPLDLVAVWWELSRNLVSELAAGENSNHRWLGSRCGVSNHCDFYPRIIYHTDNASLFHRWLWLVVHPSIFKPAAKLLISIVLLCVVYWMTNRRC
jgi:hypothetical protein